MTDDKQRPLWRMGTKTLAQELRRRADGEAVQRAFLQECDLALLLAEVVARGYAVTPPVVGREAPPRCTYTTAEITSVRVGRSDLNGGEDGVPEGMLGKRWPPLGDGDE